MLSRFPTKGENLLERHHLKALLRKFHSKDEEEFDVYAMPGHIQGIKCSQLPTPWNEVAK